MELCFIDNLACRARPKGTFTMRVLRSGIIIEEYTDHNLVVNGAFFQMARLLAGDTVGRSITKIGFGTGGVEPNQTDTGLTSPYIRNVVGYEYPDNSSVKINWALSVSEANGKAIKEFGLFTTDGTLFARKTRTGDAIPKASDISLEGSWTIGF